ncbi:hypothetical protein BDP27DRAFT_839856 [Rhodocollybia butyracea]|uniref:Protein kinase domain-containing protein n=1 Tax=Rhodocollybia butyracea TaxID=206335 RepID=A0A9P5PLW6_9AGAR|nr:hypothetical protein BDP27DRAFT_839856 [Rhodocollybia butyracea]
MWASFDGIAEFVTGSLSYCSSTTMKESELTTKPVDVDTTYDFFSLKAMNMDTTLERGGAYDYFSLDCIKIVDYGVPPPHFDTVFFAEILNEGNDSTVYGGHLLDEHGNNVHEIIIKLGKLEQMQREAENYVRLRSLQGRVIPYMLCYCVADRGNGNGHWGCLVIERFGAQLDVPIEYMEIPEQATLLNHFRDIHNEGLTHNDFESRNILQKDKEFRVIDLESLTVHVCTKCTMDFVTISSEEDGYVPLWCLCPPLRVAVEDLGFCGFGEKQTPKFTESLSALQTRFFWQNTNSPKRRTSRP